MRLKHLALGTLLCVAAMTARASYADAINPDTLDLVSATGSTVTIQNPTGSGTVQAVVYPYNFSIDGSSALTSLMCLSMNDEVTLNETWAVTEQTLTPSSDTAYLQDAWIFSQMGQTDPVTNVAYTESQVQMAVWNVLDDAAASDAAFDSTAAYLFAQSQTNSLSAASLSQFTVYAPIAAYSSTWTAGTPQTFIGEAASVTAEPSSLLLLGTGLIAATVLVLRRRTQSLTTEL